MRKTVYLERIKRITSIMGKEIDSLSKELGIADSPEAMELRDVYSRFAKRANKVAPTAYPRNKDIEGTLYDLLADTKEYVKEEGAKLKKNLGRA